jgi:hypothetical protein
MKTLTLAGAGVISLTAIAAFGQTTKTITGETTTVTATVESIERSTRMITLKSADGTYEVLAVPAEVKRFDSLKVGDTVTARYYENVVFRLKPPGEKDINSTSAGMMPSAGVKPAGTLSTQRAITATITAIDQSIPSITFTGPNGWTYSSHVEDKAALAKVKVGDRVDITWTKAALVSVDEPK